MARDNDIPDSATVGKAAWAALQRVRPDWTVDELLLHPSTAVEICKAVRSNLSKKLRDDEILRCLLNARKRGIL